VRSSRLGLYPVPWSNLRSSFESAAEFGVVRHYGHLMKMHKVSVQYYGSLVLSLIVGPESRLTVNVHALVEFGFSHYARPRELSDRQFSESFAHILYSRKCIRLRLSEHVAVSFRIRDLVRRTPGIGLRLCRRSHFSDSMEKAADSGRNLG
jgi:hypothetical protein